MTTAVDLSDVIRAALDARMGGVHIALPGKVVTYSAADQTADVRVGVRRPVPGAIEGEFVYETLPVVPAVPVVWPAGNGSHFAPGLAAGDGVLLVVCDLDPATWLRTGEVSDPGDIRKSSLAHAVCIPGLRPEGSTIAAGAKELKVATAEVGGTADAAALANAVASEFNTIAAALDTIAAAVPTTNPYTAAANTVAAIRGRIESAALKVGS